MLCVISDFRYGHVDLSADLVRRNQFNSGAFEPDNPTRNLAYGLHVLLAIVMITGRPLLLIRALRARYRRFHKINGYTYVTLTVCMWVAGQYLLWTRGTLSKHLMTGFNGIAVVVSAVIAVRAARNKRIAMHQVLAVRLFCWLMLFGQVAIDFSTFISPVVSSPAVVSIIVGSYILPLSMFEWYPMG